MQSEQQQCSPEERKNQLEKVLCYVNNSILAAQVKKNAAMEVFTRKALYGGDTSNLEITIKKIECDLEFLILKREILQTEIYKQSNSPKAEVSHA